MAQLKQLTVLLLLLQIKYKHVDSLREKPPYMDHSLLQKKKRKCFSGTLKRRKK